MKKLFGRCFNAILILALTFALCPAISAMATEDVSAFIMEGSTITGYTGPGGDVAIPASATAIQFVRPYLEKLEYIATHDEVSVVRIHAKGAIRATLSKTIKEPDR